MNKNKYLAKTAVITVAYYLLVFSLFNLRFYGSDDLLFELMSSSFSGYKKVDPNFFPLFFGNYLEVAHFNFLKLLYSKFPTVSWFIIIYQLITLSIYFTVTFFLMKKLKENLLRTVSIVFFSVFFIFFVTMTNFSSMPMLLALPIGMVISFDYKNLRNKYILISLLVGLGLACRGASFFVTYLLILIYLFIKNITYSSQKKNVIKQVFIFLSFLLLPLSIYLIKPTQEKNILTSKEYKKLILLGEQGKDYHEYGETGIKGILNQSNSQLVEFELLKNQIIYDFIKSPKKINNLYDSISKLSKTQKSFSKFWGRFLKLNRNIYTKINKTLFVIIIINLLVLFYQKKILVSAALGLTFYLGLLLIFNIKNPGIYFFYPYLFIFTCIVTFETVSSFTNSGKKVSIFFTILILVLTTRYAHINLRPSKINRSKKMAHEVNIVKDEYRIFHVIDERVLQYFFDGLKRKETNAKIITRGWRVLGNNTISFLKENNLSKNMCENLIKNDIILISNNYYAYLYLLYCDLKKEALCLKQDPRFTEFNYWRVVDYTDDCFLELLSKGKKSIKKHMPYFSKLFNDDMSLKPQMPL